MPDFLLEIGCEEIPARMIDAASRELLERVRALLQRERLEPVGAISHLDTPRAAENISGGYYSLESAFGSWRESPEHNANLLMPQATRFGIAIAKDARTRMRVYWAMEVAAEPDKPRGEPALLTSTLGGPVAASH